MVKKSVDINTKIMENVNIEDAMNEMGHGRYNYLVLATCCVINVGGIMDILGYGLVVPSATCDFNLTVEQAKILKSISFAGFFFVVPWGYIADTRGRRRVILTASAVGFLFSAIASFANSYNMILVFKFLAGCFSTTAMTLTTIYLGESTCQKQRGNFFFIKNVISSGVDFFCFLLAHLCLSLDIQIPVPFLSTYKSWRLYGLVLSFPLLIGAIMLYFLEETPMFLANKGRNDKAVEVMRIIYERNNGKHGIYPVKSIMSSDNIIETKSFWDSLLKYTVPIFKPPLIWRTFQIVFLLCICSFTDNIFFIWFPRMVNIFMTAAYGNISFCQEIVYDVTKYEHINLCLDNRYADILSSGMYLTLFFSVINVGILHIAVFVFSNWRRTFTTIAFFLAGVCCIVIDMASDLASNIVLYIMVQFTGLCFPGIFCYYFFTFPTSHRGLGASLGMMVSRLTCVIGVDLVSSVIIDFCRPTFFSWAIFLFGGMAIAALLPGDVRKKATPDSETERT